MQSSTYSEVTVSAVITRADGTVENLGDVAHWHRNPVKRLWWRLIQRLRGRAAGCIHLKER